MSEQTMFFELALSFAAAFFFAVLFNAPHDAQSVGAGIAGIGWLIFRIMDSILPAYFFATLCMAMMCEIAARLLKRPANLFIHIAVIPLVPGGGLYSTMLHLVNSDTTAALTDGARTFLAIGLMAMAIGVSSLLFKYVRLGSRHPQNKDPS